MVPPAIEVAALPAGQRARRDRIVAAALELLRAREYDAVQMRDVAETADVALGTLYRYFSSKEHLYAAVLIQWAEGYETDPRRVPTRGEADDQARLRALMRRAIRAFERWPQLLRAEMVLETSTDPNAQALFQQFAERNSATLTATLVDLSPDDARSVVEIVNSVMVGRLRSWAYGRCSIREVEQSVQRAIDLIFGQPTLGGRSNGASR